MATQVPDDVRQQILARYRDGESIRSLAKSLNKDFSTVRVNLINWGAVIRCEHKHRWRYSEEEKRRAVELYQSGSSIEEVAAVFGVTFASMKAALHRFGANIRRCGPTRTHGLDERYFQTIDSEAKAYWLGFLLADGNVCKASASGNWMVQLNLAEVDVNQVTAFTQAVRYEGPIRYRESNKSYAVQITSTAMARDLMALECIPRKSCVHGTPKIPSELVHHMYRGYFDGDGALFETPTTYSWRFEVIGSHVFIQEFQEWLHIHADVTPTKLFTRGKVTAVRCSGCQIIERILKGLYREATIYLPRKFEQYQRMLCRL